MNNKYLFDCNIKKKLYKNTTNFDKFNKYLFIKI